jgi:hypothetical protein
LVGQEPSFCLYFHGFVGDRNDTIDNRKRKKYLVLVLSLLFQFVDFGWTSGIGGFFLFLPANLDWSSCSFVQKKHFYSFVILRLFLLFFLICVKFWE